METIDTRALALDKHHRLYMHEHTRFLKNYLPLLLEYSTKVDFGAALKLVRTHTAEHLQGYLEQLLYTWASYELTQAVALTELRLEQWVIYKSGDTYRINQGNKPGTSLVNHSYVPVAESDELLWLLLTRTAEFTIIRETRYDQPSFITITYKNGGENKTCESLK